MKPILGSVASAPALAVPVRFHSGREVIETLRAMGVSVTPFLEPAELRSLLREGKARAVLEININPALVAVCREFNIPYACWTFDSGALQTCRLPFQAGDRLFIHDKRDLALAANRNARSVYLPFSAGAAFHRPPRESGFQIRILVMMNTYRSAIRMNENEFQKTLQQWPPGSEVRNRLELMRRLTQDEIRNQLDALAEDQLGPRLEAVFQANGLAFFQGHPDRFAMFLMGVGQELACRQRIRLVEYLQRFYEVDVFGDGYWREALEGMKSVRYNGLAPFDRLPDIYNTAQIAIHLSQPQCRNAIAQRVFHVLAAGGFLLAERSAVLAELFEAGRHLDTYASLEELRDKCEFYIRNPDVRLRIARQGQEAFMASHTMRHRLQFILEQLVT
ncbi:MAG: glycosyltransferase family 1 protein [Lentisphaerae bacterium]|nr:glycosyltransferase family 1 protein [Lentisphaerota bacterium]